MSLSNTTIQVPSPPSRRTYAASRSTCIAQDNVEDAVRCTSISRSRANTGGGGGGGPTTQSGLVNVAVTDLTAQIPIGIAANVCHVQANVIASGNVQDPGLCRAIAPADASNSP